MKKEKAGYMEGSVSIIINTALFFLKMWAGIVSGSLALTADAWHTLSDSISSVVVIIGTKLSARKPDKKHPFGHGRWEYVSSIFIGFLLAIIAYDFMKDSILQFQAKESANFGTIAIVVTIISIVVKEILAQYAFYLGRKSGNTAVKADGWHHRTDALSSIVVLGGIFLKDYFWWIDSALGFIISLMLFYAVYEIVKEAIDKLLGEIPNPELIEHVEALILTLTNEDLQAHHYHIHNYVGHQELTFHIKLQKDLDIETGHSIATAIENKLFDEMHIMCTVHIEPKHFKHRFD